MLPPRLLKSLTFLVCALPPILKTARSFTVSEPSTLNVGHCDESFVSL